MLRVSPTCVILLLEVIVLAKLEPGIYYVEGMKAIIYEETDEDEFKEAVKVTKELIKKHGSEGWI